MDFKDKLNEYIVLLECNAKDLAQSSGLSAATLSRYRSGERIPDNEQLAILIAGMTVLANQKGITGFSPKSAEKDLATFCSNGSSFNYEKLRRNFNTLLTVLSVNVSELSRSTHYDASNISRIRNGQRHPADPKKFSRDISEFIVRRYMNESKLAIVAELIGCPAKEISNESVYCEKLSEWLISGSSGKADYTFDFLKKLDSFDINEYIRAIHFDAIKVPSVPFQFPTSKSYFGLKQMMESELDFLKATVLSKSSEPVILYSDMPMEEMVKDPEFPKQWMFGMAMMLKKGLHLHQIHNIDRSFHEMMLGLESWIPLYMTGQVAPYYLKGVQNNTFLHSLKVSGSAAHTGEAISGYHANGRYYLTKQKDEVAFYKRMANDLLKKASPLMDIYREDIQNKLNAFLMADAKARGTRRYILSAPPVYTISEKCLRSFLHTHLIQETDRQKILRYASSQREYMEAILAHSTVQNEIPVLTKEEFSKFPPVLSLSGLFYEKDLPYTYDDYSRHLQQTKEFAESHPNYTVTQTNKNAFRNIEIAIHEGEWAMISKGKSPAIHFVIRHPKLRSAIENMVVPIIEE
ncbi:MAG: hypothetical protein Q4D60_08105 [Eubacteriales bacterium]|nr:hypothetical protein [Eubacteriales bacterium]